MLNLQVRTEYSFLTCYGKIKDIIDSQENICSITDINNTFGHIQFYLECKKQGKKTVLGVELLFCNSVELKVKRTMYNVVLLAKNQKGLQEIYDLVSESSKYKYYYNRLSFQHLAKISNNIVIIIKDSILEKYIINKDSYYAVSPITTYYDFKKNKLPIVALSENKYDKEENKYLYEIISKKTLDIKPQHLLSEKEYRERITILSEEQKNTAISNTYEIENKIESFELPKSNLPKINNISLKDLCVKGARERGINIESGVYADRLKRELEIIETKNFTDYFLIVYDLINYAKKHMLVGTGRGSSAGSLVCYLLSITEIDPIKFDLIFERFIDINRSDMPDIDIDFQDDKREKVFKYLIKKYGSEKVSKLSSIIRYKPKLLLNKMCISLDIEPWKINDLKQIIDDSVELKETIKTTKTGKECLKNYPFLDYVANAQDHASHIGKHAAGVVLSGDNISNYCSIDYSTNTCHIDKYDAETINMLKIDCLGLSTLTVINECLFLISKDRNWLIQRDIEDKKCYEILNKGNFAGVFQFEGQALINVCKQINISSFDDLAAITSIARPGTMISGGTDNYIKAKKSDKIDYLPHCEKYTKETFGVIVYQEQVMQIVREIGCLSWEDTTKIRKAMGKSLGSDYINQMRKAFIEGAKSKGVTEDQAILIWASIVTMSTYTFNKSHAVAYSMISFYCLYLKTYYPLEFALATLRHPKSDNQVIEILKELEKEGYKYIIFDKDLSSVDWEIKDNVLIGGYINLKGVQEKKAKKLIEKRDNKVEYTVAEKLLIYNAVTPFDFIYEFQNKLKSFYENWRLFCKTKPLLIKDIDKNGCEVRFICKIEDFKIRDINETYFLQKREGREITEGCLKMIDLVVYDDSGKIKGRIDREFYNDYINLIKDNKNSFFLCVADSLKDFRYIMIKSIKKITIEEIENKINKSL